MNLDNAYEVIKYINLLSSGNVAYSSLFDKHIENKKVKKDHTYKRKFEIQIFTHGSYTCCPWQQNLLQFDGPNSMMQR